jgi:phytol kinase
MTVLFDWLPPFGTLTGEIVRALIVGVGFVAVFAIAEWWQRKRSAKPEWTRKFIHFSTGLITLSYPWMFSRVETLLVLGGIVALALWFARRSGRLPSLFGVDRESLGELYYPISILLLFLLAHDQPVFYVISIFTLIVSDALAALLGQSYGRHWYVVSGDSKSLEGSGVFFLSAFLCVHLPLLLLTDLERGACVLIATQLALLITSFEAIGVGGNDNLIVPLGTYYLLVKLTPHSATGVTEQLLVQLVILAVVLLLAWRTRFMTFSGALAAHLVLYASGALGGPRWLIAPILTLFALIVLDTLGMSKIGRPRESYRVPAIFYVSIVAILVLFADNTLSTIIFAAPELANGHPLYTFFVSALAASLSVAALHLLDFMPGTRRIGHAMRPVLAAASGYLLVVPAALIAGGYRASLAEFTAAALVCAGAVAGYRLARMRISPSPDIIRELRVLAVSVLLATVVVLPAYLGFVGALNWGFE